MAPIDWHKLTVVCPVAFYYDQARQVEVPCLMACDCWQNH